MMAVDEKYKLSTYKELSVLSQHSPHKIRLVMDEATNGLYVKKVLPGTDHFNFYVRLASLRHKNLVKIHDVICCDGSTHIFEEYTNGQTLQALLENEGVQPENKAADYVMQICDALIYLHSQNPPIIHRDIKPENIMLSADGVIKLIDFDIAREFKQSAKRDTTFMGTKEYAAPEQYGYKQTDSRTDIYAIGVLLHEMLTGQLPQNNITYKGALRKIIVKCLRLEPKQRYQSVSALKKALVNISSNRYKKMGICALSAILAIAIMIMPFPKISGYLYGPNNAPSPSSQLEQNSGDVYDPDHAPSSSPQAETGQSIGDSNTPNPFDPSENPPLYTVESLMGQDYDDLYAAFEKIESFEAKPPIILEHKVIGEMIRDITGDHYDSVAGAFQEYNDQYPVFYNYLFFHLVAYNRDENGDVHDVVLFLIDKADPYSTKSSPYSTHYDVDITYYDADLETIFYFTTNDDKALLSRHTSDFISYYIQKAESPVVFSQPPVTDITGIYYIDYKQKIEIFEEAGEMKFSYTDISRSKDAEPLIVETIHKFDENHYWLRNYSDDDRLMFNFSENRLTIFAELRDSPDGVYGIGENQYGRHIIELRGVYDKA